MIVAKSPVFSHISATLSGLPTIRAFNAEKLLQQEFDDHQDLNTGVYFMFLGMYHNDKDVFHQIRVNSGFKLTLNRCIIRIWHVTGPYDLCIRWLRHLFFHLNK